MFELHSSPTGAPGMPAASAMGAGRSATCGEADSCSGLMLSALDTARGGAAARGLARCRVRGASENELLQAATDLVGMISDAQTTLARVLAELDANGTTDVRFGMRTASWVASKTGTPRGPVTGCLRVGKALRSHFDVIDDALHNGLLRYDHAKTLTDVANPRTTNALAAAQSEIIALTDGATFDQWKNDVTALGELADTDGVEPDPYENLSLKMPVTLDRTIHVDGTLDHASGLAFRQAINAKADELFKRFTRDNQTSSGDIAVPKRSTLRALALMELIRTATGAEPGSGSAPRAEITLVAHNHEVCDSEGVPLPQAAADVWGCDPDIWAVVVDNMGIPIDVGHTHRLATIAQRRAITIRDGGCTFPGCDAPINWCDLHHIHSWNHGGPTDQTNLVALCRHHHGVTHRTGWTMHLDTKQIPHWTTPTGHHLTGQRHHRQC